MRYTVLVDNTALIDRYFHAEPGFSLWLEDGDTRILFDTGYSDICITNAAKMGIPLTTAEYVVLSHGHVDHTGGLAPLLRLFAETARETGNQARPALLAHPYAISRRVLAKVGDVGCELPPALLAAQTNLTLSEKPVWITDNCVFLGEIPRIFPFEAWEPRSMLLTENGWVPDTVPDDSAIACLTGDGMVLITGCAHAGICATVAYATEICGEDRIADIIGGFHLYRAGAERIAKTAAYLAEIRPAAVHACHCTGFAALQALAGRVNLAETGVGMHCSFS
ncbi:MAG: MBL fold metallo-hydrolase [Methanomicrobiales archaeon]|nr:MBL fold metallo-hydrolase [Methanomicrobiales archaeon]